MSQRDLKLYLDDADVDDLDKYIKITREKPFIGEATRQYIYSKLQNGIISDINTAIGYTQAAQISRAEEKAFKVIHRISELLKHLEQNQKSLVRADDAKEDVGTKINSDYEGFLRAIYKHLGDLQTLTLKETTKTEIIQLKELITNRVNPPDPGKHAAKIWKLRD